MSSPNPVCNEISLKPKKPPLLRDHVSLCRRTLGVKASASGIHSDEIAIQQVLRKEEGASIDTRAGTACTR